ncbi:MAG: hypothetical protein WCJ30_20370 [Deltaproteobacteria bacterium]
MSRSVATMSLAVLLLPAVANAWLWSSPLARLLRDATVIEIVEIEAVHRGPLRAPSGCASSAAACRTPR